MRIYEALNGSGEPNGMVNFDLGTTPLDAQPKGKLEARIINNRFIRVYNISTDRPLTPALTPSEVLDRTGAQYGGTVIEVRAALNNFFFPDVIEIPEGIVIAETKTATTNDSTSVAIYSIELEEKQAINIFVRGIAKAPAGANAYTFTALGGAVRENAGAVTFSSRPRVTGLDNFSTNPRVRHSVNGNSYSIDVDSRSTQVINWIVEVEIIKISTL